jgi:glutamate dehydrogenase/leucine dehydrogenase
MSTFDNILLRLNLVKELEGLSDSDIELLKTPKKISYSELEIDGVKYPAWRIISNNALGPAKGGIRFHPEVCEDEVRSLSFWMALKNSLSGLPYGGGKGGVKFDPKNSSPELITKISRAYIQAFHEVLGPDIDVPAPDVYTTPQIMAIMLDEYEKIKGYHAPAMITGKPVELGGLELRSDSTAKGAYIVMKELITQVIKNNDLKIAIQGFGNAGLNIAKMLYADGFKITAVSDSQGGIYDEAGLDINKLIEFKNGGQPVSEFAGQKISNAEILEINCDLLLLAALENQITAANADKVQAKYIVELANGPIEATADKILFAKNIMVVPDILANSGGVVVSYFEWANNKSGGVVDPQYLSDLLNKKMIDSWNAVYQKYLEKDKKIDWRTAAYIIAIKKILSAEKLRKGL